MISDVLFLVACVLLSLSCVSFVLEAMRASNTKAQGGKDSSCPK